MNIIHRFTWKTMLKNRTRTFTTIIAIVLSTAFFTAITTLAFSIRDCLIRSVRYTEGDYYVRFDYTSILTFDNINVMAVYIVLLLSVTVLVGTMGLIYNSFSVSLSERTKQIGLLSSIGATKKQILHSIFFEAGCVALIGIPMGLALGSCISAVIISVIGLQLEYLFFTYKINEVRLTAIISPLSLGSATLIALIAIFISALIPAFRSMRITPINAIRESNEYKVNPKKSGKVGLLGHIFGLHGMLASKYFQVSRKKYRITVFSLVISITLFLSASSLGNAIRGMAKKSIQTENFDFLVSVTDGTSPDIDEVINQPGITKVAIVDHLNWFYSLTPDKVLSDAFKKAWNHYDKYFTTENRNCQPTTCYYVEDSVLEEYLIRNGLNPAPYLDEDEPVALLYRRNLKILNNTINYSYWVDPLNDETDSIVILRNAIHHKFTELYPNDYLWDFAPSNDGTLLIKARPFIYDSTESNPSMIPIVSPDDNNAIYFEMVVDEEKSEIAYYAYDPETKTRGKKAIYSADEEGLIFRQKIGAHIDELPFGVSAENIEGYFTLILPLSAYQNLTDVTTLAINVSNYAKFRDYLNANKLVYNDYYYGREGNLRLLLLLLNIFAYCFIILMAIISTVNMIGTISSNFTLRKREFAMLRSAGLLKLSLYRIAAIECLIYCIHSLLLGLPMGLIIHYAVHLIVMNAFWQTYTIPLKGIIISVCYVFAASFFAMIYSLIKMRKINLINTLKNETGN